MPDTTGIPWPEYNARPRVEFHRGVTVGPFGSRAVCTCGMVLLADHDLGAFVGVDVDLAAELTRIEADPAYEPAHVMPFAAIAREFEEEDRVNRLAALDASGASRDLDVGSDARRAPTSTEERRAARLRQRRALSPALNSGNDGKSKLGQTTEYRRVEKRRERAPASKGSTRMRSGRTTACLVASRTDLG